MKFSALVLVLNGMPWLPYLLRNLYPHFDQIVIVEGAMLSAAVIATAEGHSQDDTLAVIQNFPDPEHKIHLIQKAGFWQDQAEMGAAGAAVCHGDYLWHVDVDEFYHPHDLAWLQQHLTQNPHIEAVSLKMLHFFASLRGVVKGAFHAQGGDEPWRIFRWRPGYRYVNYEPLRLHNAQGQALSTLATLKGGDLARQHGIYFYHYAYLLPAVVYEKAVFYENKRGVSVKDGVSPLAWYRAHYEKFTPWRVHLNPRPLSWLEPFHGQHPPEILAAIREGAITPPPRPEIDRLLDGPRWRFWQKIGQIDVILWAWWDGPVRRRLRPLVRFFRARFGGYRYETHP
jgi:hypothetical protein